MTRATRHALVALLMWPALAWSQPNVVGYQGFLTDEQGQPIDGVVDLYFKIFSAPTGGTEIASQTETSADVQLGTFAVGLAVDEADLLAASDLYLEVAVGTPGNVLLPRQHLGSVPFALRCGDVDSLDGLDAAGYQTGVTASCAAGSAIRAVNANGTVDCEIDDGQGGGVASVTAGSGLLDFGTATDPLLALNLGAGLFTDASDLLVPNFGGGGVATTVSRADHQHAYLPLDFSGGCFFPEKMTGIDASTGAPICGLDQSTSYGPGPSGNITFDGFAFDVNPVVTLPGSVTVTGGDEFIYGSSHQGVRTLQGSAFRPADASFAFWNGDYVRGYPSAFNGTYLYAPLHLPDGVNVDEIRITYDEFNDPSDSIYCALGALELATGNYFQPGGTTPECPFTCGGGPLAQASAYPGTYVDNLNYAYVADCYMYNNGTDSVSLHGYQVFYSYPDLQGPP